QRPHIIELTMPPKPSSDLIDPRPYLNWGCVWPKENGPDLTYSNLAHFRKWSEQYLPHMAPNPIGKAMD
ncbi:MAG TPA: hypothetical protein VF630_20185, partial [Hymenobacter sp.]